MRGPTDQRPAVPDFGRVAPEHAATFLGIMTILHGEPAAPAFGRLLKKSLQPDDYVLLAHIFEEISVMALHHLIPEALLFDAFGFDLYWEELREDILSLRQQTGNEKFCENFEIASDRAREYRNDRPPKRRWHHRPEGEGPEEPPSQRPLAPAPRSPAEQPRPAHTDSAARPRG